MTVAELTQWVLDLPLEERLLLAEILWESLEQEPAGSLHRKRRHAEIALFVREYAGTSVDLDLELEQAGLEVYTKATRLPPSSGPYRTQSFIFYHLEVEAKLSR